MTRGCWFVGARTHMGRRSGRVGKVRRQRSEVLRVVDCDEGFQVSPSIGLANKHPAHACM